MENGFKSFLESFMIRLKLQGVKICLYIIFSNILEKQGNNKVIGL